MTAPISGPQYTSTTFATPQVDRGDQMGKDVFLKLLVAQLKYQDPSNPADSSQMMSQTATFTQVEKLEEIAKQNSALLLYFSGALEFHGARMTTNDQSSATPGQET